MFEFSIENKLRKKIEKLKKKDRILVRNLKNKFLEIIDKDIHSVDRYKNLKSPLNEYKRIHLTDNYIILFKGYKEKKHIVFVDILHWDFACR